MIFGGILTLATLPILISSLSAPGLPQNPNSFQGSRFTHPRPNPPLNSDPTGTARLYVLSPRIPVSAHHPAAGRAGYLHSLGRRIKTSMIERIFMHSLGILLSILIPASPGADSNNPSSSSEIRPSEMVQLAIAGGRTVALPVARPSENDIAIIRSAGFVIEPSQANSKQPILKWKFSVQPKTSNLIEEIIIEEVAPSATPITYLSAKFPTLKDNLWTGFCEPQQISQASLPWLYSTDQSIFVFKFTVKIQNHEPSTLYQACWYSHALKVLFLSKASQVHSAK